MRYFLLGLYLKIQIQNLYEAKANTFRNYVESIHWESAKEEISFLNSFIMVRLTEWSDFKFPGLKEQQSTGAENFIQK